jgi:transcriptional regulator with XRE-family HTH domain
MYIIIYIQRKQDGGGIAMSLGLRIRTLRKALGLTQQGLAERTQVSRIYIQALESNRRTPSMKLLSRLANSLEVEVQDLVKTMSTSPSGRLQLEEVFQAAPETEVWYRSKRLKPKELRFVQSLIDAAIERWEEEDRAGGSV